MDRDGNANHSQAHKHLHQGVSGVTKSHCCCDAHRIHADKNQRGEGGRGYLL